jgi:UrcA family protein
MYTEAAFILSRALLGFAAVACAFLASHALAESREVTVAIHVNTQGLDLSQSVGAQKFYERLKHAAQVACTHGNRVDLLDSPNPAACYEAALGNAVRSVKLPLLTLIYLETHTLRTAAAHGIHMPPPITSK